MAGESTTEGLVIKFGYDLTSGMDQGVRDFYASLNRLERAARSKRIKVEWDFGENHQAQFDRMNHKIEETNNLLKASDAMLAAVGGDVTKMSATTRASFDAINLQIQKNLKEVQAFATSLENLPQHLGTSVNAMKQQLASLSAQWNEMTVGEKFSGKGFSRMSAEAKRLLKAYIKLQTEIEKHGQGIDIVAKKSRETALLRKKHLTTEAEYLEKIRILEDRIANTPIGTAKYNKYKRDLDEVSAKLNAIRGKQDAANKSLALTEIKMNRLNNSFRLADHYTGRLLIRLAAYAGVAMFARMLRNIKDITAEFELQQVALGAIIQDTEKASKLFNQIKAQAIRSPFEVKELVTYTKQLAAYRVETERLFDVTMQLADISSALGVDMQRLILAYGQVKAASVLRGQELRQFTEAGIPLVQKLADKFTELRGQVVSTGEVFELISRRAVSFSMIEEIFNDMTAAGGEFYQMQEKQAKTLKGRWTNLKDAISITFDEIGRAEGTQNLLNGIINATTSLAKNWRVWSAAIGITTKSLIALAVVARNTKTAMSALTGAELAQAIAEGKLTLASGERLKVSQAAARMDAVKQVHLRRISLLTRKAAQDNNVLTASSLRLRMAYEKLSIAFSAANRDLRYIKGMRSADYLMLKAARSTNVFTASLYRLAASIQKLWVSIGPAGWIIAALTAIISIIRKITKEAKDFDKFAQSAANAVAAHETLVKRMKSIQELTDTYQSLSVKTERTDAESKKLNATIKALTEAYPVLTKVMNDYSNDVDKIIQKIGNLTEKEQEAELKRLKATERATERALKRAQDEVNKFRILNNGKVVKLDYLFTKFTDIEELNKAQDEVDRLREELQGLKDAIAGVEDAAGASQELSGWRKKITTFQKVISSAPKPVQAFIESEVESISTLTDAWDKAAQAWKDSNAEIEKYEKSLTGTNLDDEQRKQIEDTLEYQRAVREVNYELLEYYNQLGLLEEKAGRSVKTDTSMFKDELDLVKRIYKKFTDLRKLQSENEARESVAAAYGNLTTIDFLSPKELAARIADIRRRALIFAASSSDADVKKAIAEFVDTATEEIDNTSYNELEQAIEERLQNLAKDISTSKEAGQFYEEIFGKTFNRSLSEALTESVYGADRISATKALREYIQEVFGPEGLNAFGKGFMPNWNWLEDILKEYGPTWSEKNRKLAQEIIENGRKTSMEQYKQWMNDLAKEKDVLDRRIELHHQTIQQIRKIEADSANLTPTQQSELISQYRKREQKLASDIAYQAFKESPAYVQLFTNLDNASVSMLERLKSNIQTLRSEWSNLDPANLKELQSRIQEIDKVLVQKRPFEQLAKGLQEYYKNSTRRRGADKRAIQSARDETLLRKTAIEDAVRLEEAEQRLRDMQEGKVSASEEDLQAQRQIVEELTSQASYSRTLYENAKNRADTDAEDVDHWRRIREQIQSSMNIIAGYSDQLTTINDMVFRIGSAFNYADDIQKEFLNNMKDGINDIIGGVGTLAKGIGEIYGGDKVQGVIDVVVGLERAVEGTLNTARAQELRDINREIKNQEEAIDNLERAYSRLREAEEKAFGTEWIQNRQHELDILEAQAEAYRKKADAEMQKADKDRNEEQAREWYQKSEDIMDEIIEREKEISEHFLGTDMASAARDFASAWLDAYKSYGNTIDAMEQKFHDMMENMVKESIMARILQPFIDRIMAPFDELDKDSNTNDLLAALDRSLTIYQEGVGGVNDSLIAVTNVLRARGFDLRDTVSGMKGISKDIASASEQSIMGLAAGINTQNFYISGIYTSVNQILSVMTGSTSSSAPTRAGEFEVGAVDYTSHLQDIVAHTTSISQDISEIRTMLGRVISSTGSRTFVNVKI